jgi:hypothetical protein
MNEDSNNNLHKEKLGKNITEKVELEKGWKKKVVTVQHSTVKKGKGVGDVESKE